MHWCTDQKCKEMHHHHHWCTDALTRNANRCDCLCFLSVLFADSNHLMWSKRLLQCCHIASPMLRTSSNICKMAHQLHTQREDRGHLVAQAIVQGALGARCQRWVSQRMVWWLSLGWPLKPKTTLINTFRLKTRCPTNFKKAICTDVNCWVCMQLWFYLAHGVSNIWSHNWCFRINNSLHVTIAEQLALNARSLQRSWCPRMPKCSQTESCAVWFVSVLVYSVDIATLS